MATKSSKGSKLLGKLSAQGDRVQLAEGVEVTVRPLSVRRVMAVQEAQQKLKQDGNEAALIDLSIDVFLECCLDPDTGERLFDDSEREQVLELPLKIIDRVVTAAAAIDAKVAAKN